jgi:hypothetical protein
MATDAHELATRSITEAIANVPTRREDESVQDFHAGLVVWAVGRSDIECFAQALVRVAVDRLEAVSNPSEDTANTDKPDRKTYMRDLMRKRRAAAKTEAC